MCFAGDKGGSMESKGNFTKWAFYPLKKEKSQDLNNLTTYAMTNAPGIYIE